MLLIKMENCCQNPDIKYVNGMATCVKCGIVHHSYFEEGWVDYNQHNIQQNQFITELLMLNKNCKMSN